MEANKDIFPFCFDQKDRRQSQRIIMISRIGVVAVENDRGFARVHNISDGGVEISCKLDLAVGQDVTLSLSETVVIEARTVWQREHRFGLAFREEVDCADLLRRLAFDARAGRARPLRLPVATRAVTASEMGRELVEVSDISQRGMKVHHKGSFKPGIHVKICLPGGIERNGVVRWASGEVAGIMLLDLLSPEDLGSACNLASA